MLRSKSRFAFLSWLVAALVAAGCGSASHPPATATQASATGTATAATVSRLAGQQHSASHGSATGVRTSVEKPAPPVPPRRFAYLANALCNSVAGGTAAIPTSSGRVQSVAAAARVAAIASRLSRLASTTGRLASVTPLLHAYRALAVAAQGAHGKNDAAVRAAERQATAAAQSLNAPSCAPPAQPGQ